MDRFSRQICVAMTLLALFAAGGGDDAAGQNIVAAIDLQELDRKLSSATGHMAIVFMAAWCMPCIEELPTVNELYQKYGPHGLHVIGVSLDLGGPQVIQPFVNEHKVGFPVFWVGEEAIKAYQIRGIPLILLVENGKITDRIVGKRGKKDLDEIFSGFLE